MLLSLQQLGGIALPQGSLDTILAIAKNTKKCEKINEEWNAARDAVFCNYAEKMDDGKTPLVKEGNYVIANEYATIKECGELDKKTVEVRLESIKKEVLRECEGITPNTIRGILSILM